MAAQFAETTWLEGIVEIGSMPSPQGDILLITLSNQHRYAIPLFNQQVQQGIHRITSPITIADKLPTNGDGTHASG